MVSPSSDREALAPVSQPLQPDNHSSIPLKGDYRIGAELGVDPKTILATSHGRRSIDVMGLYDKTKANWECTLSTSADFALET